MIWKKIIYYYDEEEGCQKVFLRKPIEKHTIEFIKELKNLNVSEEIINSALSKSLGFPHCEYYFFEYGYDEGGYPIGDVEYTIRFPETREEFLRVLWEEYYCDLYEWEDYKKNRQYLNWRVIEEAFTI